MQSANLTLMAERLKLPKTIVDRANHLFKMVNDGELRTRGRSKISIAATSIYIACRQEGVPRTFEEIAAVSAVSKREIGRVFKLILKAHKISVEVVTAGDYVSRFCGTLSLSRNVQIAATTIAKRAVDIEIGNDPPELSRIKFSCLSVQICDRLCGSSSYLHGEPGQRGEENPEGDRRHSRGVGRHHQNIL